MNGLGTVDAGELGNLHGIGMVHIVIHLHAAAQPDWRFGLASNSKVSYLPKTKDRGGGRLARSSGGSAGLRRHSRLNLLQLGATCGC